MNWMQAQRAEKMNPSFLQINIGIPALAAIFKSKLR